MLWYVLCYAMVRAVLCYAAHQRYCYYDVQDGAWKPWGDGDAAQKGPTTAKAPPPAARAVVDVKAMEKQIEMAIQVSFNCHLTVPFTCQ